MPDPRPFHTDRYLLGSSVDPASLGIPALLLGWSDPSFTEAARRQAEFLLHDCTRYVINSTHSAISHRDEPPQAWGDFVYMVPPFLAYYGIATQDITYLEESVKQIVLYRDILAGGITLSGGEQCHGLWRHIATEPTEACCTDPWIWTTSNAWVYAGTTRVLAAILKWQPFSERKIKKSDYEVFQASARRSLVGILSAMLRCHMAYPRDAGSHLIKNYVDGPEHESAQYAFGDTAGTAMITAAIYRLAVLLPGDFATHDIMVWADANRKAVAKHVNSAGKVSPVADVLAVPCKVAAEQTSEGQSMAILMYSAYRDCVQAGVCSSVRPWWSQITLSSFW